MHERGVLRGGGIVATVMSNQGLEDYMRSCNLKLHRSDVGDKHVLELMKENGINFGGEQSGHVIVSDYAKTGDGLVSALQTLALLLTKKKKASQALRPFALYPQTLVNVNVKAKKPLESLEGLCEILSEIDAEGVRHLIRYSGTENKLRILLEAKDAKRMNIRMEELVAYFAKALND